MDENVKKFIKENVTIDERKKLIVITKECKMNSHEKMYEFIENLFEIKDNEIDVDWASAGLAVDYFHYWKKYMGFFDVPKNKIDTLYEKFHKNKNIEWIILSLK